MALSVGIFFELVPTVVVDHIGNDNKTQKEKKPYQCKQCISCLEDLILKRDHIRY